MKKIAAIVVLLVAGNVFGQGGALNSDALEHDSLKSLKHGFFDSLDVSDLSGKLQLPDVYQHTIPDSLLKFYENDMSLPENRFYYRYDSRPGYRVPEMPLPKQFDRGVPYYDNMPNPLNNKNYKDFEEKRSVPVPDFPDWKVQEIKLSSERS